MVSSGTVNSDASTFGSILSKYDSIVGELDGNWKGNSYDNFKSKASEFSGSYPSTVTTQMSAFASACDLYEQYKNKKSALATAESNYNTAVANSRSGDASKFNSEISSIKTEMQSLKSQIESQLSAASSTKLEASSTSASVSSSGPVSTSGGKDWTDDANFVYFNQSGGWDRYGYSSGGSNSMGASGCGPAALAMVAASLGFDVTPNDTAAWSTAHGYHPTGGTTEGFFTAYADDVGMKSRVLGKNANNVREALQNGELVVLHVGPGDFTKNGHYIVARGYDEASNKILIADPNHTSNNTWWDLDRVVSQLKNTEGNYSWAYSV